MPPWVRGGGSRIAVNDPSLIRDCFAPPHPLIIEIQAIADKTKSILHRVVLCIMAGLLMNGIMFISPVAGPGISWDKILLFLTMNICESRFCVNRLSGSLSGCHSRRRSMNNFKTASLKLADQGNSPLIRSDSERLRYKIIHCAPALLPDLFRVNGTYNQSTW